MASIIRDGEKYLSSKEASEKFSYAQDYIGELCRDRRAVCAKVGRSWYIREKDLEERAGALSAEGENGNENGTRVPLTRDGEADIVAEEGGDFIRVKDKQYTSSSRASRITGYSRDYIGQLIRSNKIPAHKIGSTWYIDSGALMRHKGEAAHVAAKERWARMRQNAPVRYNHDSSPLFPSLEHKHTHTSILDVLAGEVEQPPEVALPVRAGDRGKPRISKAPRISEIDIPKRISKREVTVVQTSFLALAAIVAIGAVGQAFIVHSTTYTRVSHGVWLTKTSVEVPKTKELTAAVAQIFTTAF